MSLFVAEALSIGRQGYARNCKVLILAVRLGIDIGGRHRLRRAAVPRRDRLRPESPITLPVGISAGIRSAASAPRERKSLATRNRSAFMRLNTELLTSGGKSIR